MILMAENILTKEELTAFFVRVVGIQTGAREALQGRLTTDNDGDTTYAYYRPTVSLEQVNFDIVVTKDDVKLEEPSRTTLVIPDAHVGPNQDLSRFSSLGQFIVDKRPDNIVSLGDFATLESLSAWDQGKGTKMEGRRYSEDCRTCIAAIDLMLSPLRRLQARQKKNKEPLYAPRLVFIEGNHETRLSRYVESKPELAEHLDIQKDLQLEESGFTDFVPYKEFIEIEGVLFTHAVMNAANQANAGKTALASVAQSVSKSTIMGHLHRYETVNYYRHGADDIIQIVSAGCFFEHTDDYALGAMNAYWRGILLLHHIKGQTGRFDVEQISIQRLKSLW